MSAPAMDLGRFSEASRSKARAKLGAMPAAWRPVAGTVINAPVALGPFDVLRALDDHTEREVAELREAMAEHTREARKALNRMRELVRASDARRADHG